METDYRKFKGNSLLKLVDNYVLVDIETTGLYPKYDDIIEIGAIKVENNVIIDEYQTLIKPNRKLSDFIINLTGITNEMLDDAQDIDDALNGFLNFSQNNILIAHNANFDINFLYDKSYKYVNKFLKNDFVDTMRIARLLLPDLLNYKLGTLAEYFNVDYSSAHRGLSDVNITYQVYNQLKSCNKNYNLLKL